MTADLTNPIFQNETEARKHFETIRWPNGPVCSQCGAVSEHVTKLEGKSHRPGLYQCNACRETFTVTTGSVMESSHIPLHKWALAFHLMASSKKGIAAHQLHRMLGITYKSAWFMAHRIREAMSDKGSGPLGGDGKTVEVDETYHGPSGDVFRNKEGWSKKRGTGDKRMVVTLVERGGRARSIHGDKLNKNEVANIVRENLDRASAMMTDEARMYRGIGREFAKHETVMHAGKEYVRGDAHTNTVEGFFSIFKRGMVGVYQHCGDRHLQRYLNEFDFRYSNRVALGVDDVLRTMRAIKGAEGKRLTYRQPRRTGTTSSAI
jgi:transposase-like protein